MQCNDSYRANRYIALIIAPYFRYKEQENQDFQLFDIAFSGENQVSYYVHEYDEPPNSYRYYL